MLVNPKRILWISAALSLLFPWRSANASLILVPLLHFYQTNGSYPTAPLIEGNYGNLYGTTNSGSGSDKTAAVRAHWYPPTARRSWRVLWSGAVEKHW